VAGKVMAWVKVELTGAQESGLHTVFALTSNARDREQMELFDGPAAVYAE